jgi:uncharacterized protein (TIGR02300 family)
VAKPEWGTKRECTECGGRFYDLNRDPIICPTCDVTFVIPIPKPAAKSKAKAPAPVKPVVVVEKAAEETDDETALLKVVGIEADETADDDGEEDGVVGDVFVEEDDEDDVTNVLDAPVATPTVE